MAMKVLKVMAMALIAVTVWTVAAKAESGFTEQVDQWCRNAGDLAFAVAQGRDSGVSKRKALQIAAANSTPETKRFGRAILEKVYGAPNMTASSLYAWAFNKCKEKPFETIDRYDENGNLIKQNH